MPGQARWLAACQGPSSVPVPCAFAFAGGLRIYKNIYICFHSHLAHNFARLLPCRRAAFFARAACVACPVGRRGGGGATMAPRRKPGVKAKGVVAKKPLKKCGPKKIEVVGKFVEASGVVDLLEEDEVDDDKKLERRSEDVQVDRYCERKLSHVHAERLLTLRNASNQSIKQFVKAEMKAKKLNQGRLASAFTVKLYSQFDLLSGIWDALALPKKSAPDLELREKLNLCHDENPAMRNIKPLMTYLLQIMMITHMSFIGLLKGVLAGPLLNIEKAFRLQAGVLGMIARLGLDEVYAEEWAIIRVQLDVALRFVCEKALKDGAGLASWMKSRAPSLGLYIDSRHIDDLIAANGEYHKVPFSVKAMMQSGFLTGITMFKSAWLGCAQVFFLQELTQALKDLEYNEFKTEDCNTFMTIQNTRAQELVKLKPHNRRVKWQAELRMFDIVLTPWNLDDPRDATAHQFWNRVKTIAVNTGQVEANFYERLLYPLKSISNCPTHVLLPPQLINKITPARDHIAELLKGVCTIDVAAKKIRKAAEVLVDYDPYIESDIIFVEKHAKTLLMAKVSTAIGATMPSSTVEMELSTSLDKMRFITRSPEAVACGKDFVEDLRGIVAMLAQLGAGFPPKEQDIDKMNPLAKCVLHSAQYFLKYEYRVAKDPKTIFDKPYSIRELRGNDALQFHFKACNATMLTDGRLENWNDLKNIKNYRWLLDPLQQKQLKDWLQQVPHTLGPGGVDVAPDFDALCDKSPVSKLAIGKSSGSADLGESHGPSDGNKNKD